MLDFLVSLRIIRNVQKIEDLCNGSTPDSDSVCGGSNPSSSAKNHILRKKGVVFYLCTVGNWLAYMTTTVKMKI